MRFLRTAALSGAALLAAAAMAACGDDDDSNSDTTPTSTTTTETRSPEATATRPAGTTPAGTATPSGGGAAARCGADDLDLSLLPAGGAAGTHFVALSVTNTSGEDCVINGFPGVSLTDGSGDALGEPADRNPAVGAQAITLAPGEAAHAMLGIPNHQNYPPGECEGPSEELVMYPPDELEPITAPFEDYACPGLSVRVFEPGANEPGR